VEILRREVWDTVLDVRYNSGSTGGWSSDAYSGNLPGLDVTVRL
jgi:hypothetical protein